MEDDGAGNLHFSQEIEISQDEENLALLLILLPHVLLENKELVGLVVGVCLLSLVGIIHIVGSPLPIS